MSLTSIYEEFFGERSAIMSFIDPFGGKETSFTLDVTNSISTKLGASITKFPVEGKENITDHVQPSPLSLSLECFISESPSDPLKALAGTLLGAAASSVLPNGLEKTFVQAFASAAVSAAGSGFGKNAGRYEDANWAPLLTERDRDEAGFPKRAMQGLTKMFQAGVKFNLHTFFTKELYTDMVMTSITFNQSVSTGDSLAFSMTCEQIKTTAVFAEGTSQEMNATNPAGGSASSEAEKGKKTAKGGAADKAANESTLHSWWEAGKKLVADSASALFG